MVKKRKKHKKIRAYQMAKQLGISFKEFQQYAKDFGRIFRSAQNSLEATLANELIEKIRLLLASSQQDNVEKQQDNVEKSDEMSQNNDNANQNNKIEDIKESNFVNNTSNLDSYSLFSVDEKSSDQKNIEPETTQVLIQFNFHHDKTVVGDTLCVCGSISELGEWNPENSLQLDSTHWPHWIGELTLSPNVEFDFKLLIKNNNNYIWENGENRNFVVLTENLPLKGTFR